jgi:hypothetical protein
MKKIYILSSIILVVAVVIAALFYYKGKLSSVTPVATNQSVVTGSTSAENSGTTVVPTDISAPISVPVPPPVDPLLNTTTGLDYPMPDFALRNSVNFFGTYYPSGTPRSQYPDSVCPNNTLYTGYHAADDLEIMPTEQNIDVPVYAVSDGVVQFAGSASGYGGLVIISFTYQNQSYTALYGHVDTRTLKFAKGQKVSKGNVLANLAPACSSYSGNNRKHLHFAIHKGTSIVESGYVSTKSALDNWLDPRAFFGL